MENDNRNAKDINLDIMQYNSVYQVARALASEERLKILLYLSNGYLGVQEISERLHCPPSTTALHVRILEDAGLVRSEYRPGVHGSVKLVSRMINSVYVDFRLPNQSGEMQIIEQQIPIGAYSKACIVGNTCGLASDKCIIGEYDNVYSFYCVDRLKAQLLWFREGYVEYDCSLLILDNINLEWMEISFEACSEAPMFHDPWPSDISICINNKRIGTWTCPADLGGRRGILNPSWWPDTSTQYGFLKTWKVNQDGSYLENKLLSNTTLKDLNIGEYGKISLRIGVEEDAQNKGGINLFGERFGDYAQSIRFRFGYRLKTNDKKSSDSEF